jgi:hypothetical protein
MTHEPQMANCRNIMIDRTIRRFSGKGGAAEVTVAGTAIDQLFHEEIGRRENSGESRENWRLVLQIARLLASRARRRRGNDRGG